MHTFLLDPLFHLSCGFFHTVTLDANSAVWIFESWGRPFRLISPLLDCSSPETTPSQTACSLLFSAVLMKSGDVCVWQQNRNTWYLGAEVIIPDGGTVIPCYTQEKNVDVAKLPILPNLPRLPATGLSEKEHKNKTKLIRIAVTGGILVGLTNKGHVLMMDGFNGQDPPFVWHYVSESVQMICYLFSNNNTQLPDYSEIDKVKKHPDFHTTIGINSQKRPQVELSSDIMLITHVSYISSISSEFCV